MILYFSVVYQNRHVASDQARRRQETLYRAREVARFELHISAQDRVETRRPDLPV